MEFDWAKEFSGAVTVCDPNGIILYMNDKSIATFIKPGEESLIGCNIFDCHPPAAQEILRNLMKEQKTNIYTIEKKGKKKMIYQSPWYKDGKYMGFVELSLEIPFDLVNKIRG
jgi:transcriptional regulator with PAS, ATPase and Fis domain